MSVSLRIWIAHAKYLLKRWAELHVFVYTRPTPPAGMFGVIETPELIPSRVTLDGVDCPEAFRGNTVEGWVESLVRGDDGAYMTCSGAILTERHYGDVRIYPGGVR